VSDREAAESAHRQAGVLIRERRFREAIEPAAEACRLRPDWAAAWWNHAVALKHGHRWADCLAACDRAIALDDEPEVVFGTRLDPCRVRLVSVPLPDSAHRFGDIVLHDGEPRGKRGTGDGEVTVFDELLLLEPSTYGTWTIEASCRGPEERDALVALFDDVDGAIEDWTESLVVLCARCSLGEPHEHHETQRQQGWRVERRLGLALRDERDLGRLRQRPDVRGVARDLRAGAQLPSRSAGKSSRHPS
jgi:hypothetical protein